MAVSKLNEDTLDQICDLLENLQQIEKLKNKDMRILLDKIVRQYGGKVVNKWEAYYLHCYERHKAAKLCKVLQIIAQSSLSLIIPTSLQ